MKEFIFEGTLNGKIIKDYIDANDRIKLKNYLKEEKLKFKN